LVNSAPGLRADAQAMSDDLLFKVVRSNGTDEVCAELFEKRHGDVGGYNG
jgi:hypothetical protein